MLIACQKGHVEVVELLLAHPDVAVNQAEKVRREREAGRERECGLGNTARCCGRGRLTSQP